MFYAFIINYFTRNLFIFILQSVNNNTVVMNLYLYTYIPVISVHL